MMEDENLAQFQALTGADLTKARQYLQISENDLERAVDLFFNTGGIDLLGDTSTGTSRTSRSVEASTQPEIVNLESDEENETPKPRSTVADPSTEDDEAMARRLQAEMFGEGPSATGSRVVDADGYRAPIARTRETLVGGPGADDYDTLDAADRGRAVLEQLRAREQARLSRNRRPGIFNQQPAGSIWNESTLENEQRHTAAAMGAASSRSSKATQLAEMYRPPFDLISPMDFEMARDEGKEHKKWLLINIQDTSIFDCQVLNRDLWKDEGIRETIKEHFIFLQYTKDDPAGDRYTNYYFRDRESQDSYPHIAIVDPRTGEQVKVWSGPPPPKPMEFLMQLHEFLDRYSLDLGAKNPVARRKPQERRESRIERMTEDEQLEWAIKHSVEGHSSTGPADDDPDALTRSIPDLRKKDRKGEDTEMAEDTEPTEEEGASPFVSISSTKPHTEPDASTPSTRIQFRHSGGRVIRRFAVSDPVRCIYEWLKAAPLSNDKAGISFELVSGGQNLIESLESTIEDAGLKNATVMVEYLN